MNHIFVIILCYGIKSTYNISTVLDLYKIKYTVCFPCESNFNFKKYTHIILSGGPKHLYNKDKYILPNWVIDSDIPVLGICYGMQLICYTYGGIIKRLNNKEYGKILVKEIINNKETTNLRWMNRFDYIYSLPLNFYITGLTYNNYIASFTDFKKWWAVQYHPESPKCSDFSIIYNFLTMKTKNIN